MSSSTDSSATLGNAWLMFISGMAGGASGGISKFMVYPLDTIKKHMQVQILFNTFQGTAHDSDRRQSGKNRLSLYRCFRNIIH
eukprot:CAMPEP_0114448050 /NCGR_PEP_ID=MMETSP0103-20121206/20107_1 /TAXON_ID=37642 ORGANISM="Paraphysomonas imperforata, Strain PA2" /NCGR_SAMPLE_ID=MMETSP0103 /ASSEMBLY_ACC=CAM_ASM_000201 /LENGTH=82 /DNA_ID=CAMNT_0001620017 /DNA_START=181 /DNA_END=426 /DNA_ORIENTATION=+